MIVSSWVLNTIRWQTQSEDSLFPSKDKLAESAAGGDATLTQLCFILGQLSQDIGLGLLDEIGQLLWSIDAVVVRAGLGVGGYSQRHRG